MTKKTDYCPSVDMTAKLEESRPRRRRRVNHCKKMSGSAVGARAEDEERVMRESLRMHDYVSAVPWKCGDPSPPTCQEKGMGGSECCVKSCGRSSHDHRGMNLSNGLTFHCFPAWRTNEGGRISELTRRRRAAWVAAIARSDITFNCIPSSMRVCSRHFHSGKPAYEMLDLDPDWVPSLHLGHDEGKSSQPEAPSKSKRKRKRRRLTEEQPAGGKVGGWRDTAILLRGDERNQPGDQNQSQDQYCPAGRRTNVGFRDFFRSALEASLEASIRSRAQSKNRSSTFEVELNLKLPPAADEESSSSSCLKCVRLQSRIQELERELFRLTAEQQVMNSLLGPMEQEPVLESPEDDEEKKVDDAAEYVPHVEVVFQDEDSQSISSPSSSPPSSSFYPITFVPPPRPSRPPPRFRKEWLTQFPFLRYSQSQDIMWCHVCRIQSDETQQNHGLIKGSRDFKRNSVMKHSNTKYHQDNMKRFSWSGQL